MAQSWQAPTLPLAYFWYGFVMEKVLLVGNFGGGNVGDELILYYALQQSPDATVMTVNPEYTRRFVGREDLKTMPWPPTGIRTFLKFFLSREYRKSLTNKDITRVVFVGGGLFAIHTYAYVVWVLVTFWLKIFSPNATFSAEHMGIDAPQNIIQRLCLRYFLRNINSVTVRDNASKMVVESMGYSAKNTEDRVHVMAENTNNQAQDVVLINALRPMNKNDIVYIYKRFKGENLQFVAMTERDKQYASGGMKVVYPATATEVLELYSSAKIVVGERLHSVILGQKLSGSVYLLHSPYSQKVKHYAEEHEITELRSTCHDASKKV